MKGINLLVTVSVVLTIKVMGNGEEPLYYVDIKPDGDEVYNVTVPCSRIKAQDVTNEYGKCKCVNNGTFYYDAFQGSYSFPLYASLCFDNYPGIRFQNTAGKLYNQKSIPFFKWIYDSWETNEDLRIAFSNNTLIAVQHCPYLVLSNDTANVEVMTVDGEWEQRLDENNVFRIKRDGDNYMLNVGPVNKSLHEGRTYNLWLDCHETNPYSKSDDDDGSMKLSLIIKFQGTFSYDLRIFSSTLSPPTGWTSLTKTNSGPTTQPASARDTTNVLKNKENGSSSSVGAIVGGVIGSSVFVLLVLLLICYRRRYVVKTGDKSQEQPPKKSYNQAQNQNLPMEDLASNTQYLSINTPPPVPDSPRLQLGPIYEYPDVNKITAGTSSYLEPTKLTDYNKNNTSAYQDMEYNENTSPNIHHALQHTDSKSNGLYHHLNHDTNNQEATAYQSLSPSLSSGNHYQDIILGGEGLYEDLKKD